MLRVVLALTLFLLFGSTSHVFAADCTYTSKPADASATLRRGINLTRWWEDDRHQYVTEDEMANLRALGFDFVRLPVSPQWIGLEDVDEREEKMAQLRCDIISLLNADLSVVIDLHAMGAFQEDLASTPDQAAARLENLWRHIKPVVADLPAHRIFLSLYNEPHIDTNTWWDIQGLLVQSLRPIFPHNTFIVTAGPDSGPWDLAHMKPYADKNVIYDFHFYQPMLFTHHGADWLSNFKPEDKTTPIVYPVKPDTEVGEGDMVDYVAEGWNRDHLDAFIRKIASWSKHNSARIACLEFGVYRPYVDRQSRLNWIGDMREILEKHNIPWAMWEYSGSFGMLNRSGNPEEGIVNVLGLNQGSSQ